MHARREHLGPEYRDGRRALRRPRSRRRAKPAMPTEVRVLHRRPPSWRISLSPIRTTAGGRHLGEYRSLPCGPRHATRAEPKRGPFMDGAHKCGSKAAPTAVFMAVGDIRDKVLGPRPRHRSPGARATRSRAARATRSPRARATRSRAAAGPAAAATPDPRRDPHGPSRDPSAASLTLVKSPCYSPAASGGRGAPGFPSPVGNHVIKESPSVETFA
jgi:hypothetical protein